MAREVDPRRIEVVDRKVADILRTKTPAEKVEMMLEAAEVAREMLAARISYEHGDWTPSEVAAEVARRILDGSTPSHKVRR
jgi:hypothetical protein